jgi:hypothetical protein
MGLRNCVALISLDRLDGFYSGLDGLSRKLSGRLDRFLGGDIK